MRSRRREFGAVAFCVVIIGCSEASPPSGTNASLAPPKTEDPSTTTPTTPSTAFRGSFDAARGTLEISSIGSEAGGLKPLATLPSGTGANTITPHTIPGSVSWNAGSKTLTGQVALINNFGVSVSGLSVVIDSVTPSGVTSDGPWSYADTAAGGTSNTMTWTFTNPAAGNFGFSGHVVGTMSYATCKQVLAAAPGSASGTYTLTPSTGSMTAYCDMTFDAGDGNGAGGWTLVESYFPKAGPQNLTQGTVTPGTSTYTPVATLMALSNVSTQVHIRTTGLAATESITSRVGSQPILNFRVGIMADGDNGTAGGSEVARWTGPFADATHLNYTCGNYATAWPNAYQSCGTNGLHLWQQRAGWSWSSGDANLNTAFQVYVR